MRRRASLRSLAPAVAAVAALAAAAAGCGGDDEPPAPSTSTSVAPTAPATTPPPPTTPLPTTATTTTAPTTTPPASPSDAQLRATAASYARRTLGVPTRTGEVTLLRSRRDPRWAIASGARGRTLWVVWLRGGEVALATKDPARLDPPEVPCDVRPAFSEPSC